MHCMTVHWRSSKCQRHKGLVRLAGRQDLFVVVRLLAPHYECQITNPERAPKLFKYPNSISYVRTSYLLQLY